MKGSDGDLISIASVVIASQTLGPFWIATFDYERLLGDKREVFEEQSNSQRKRCKKCQRSVSRPTFSRHSTKSRLPQQ